MVRPGSLLPALVAVAALAGMAPSAQAGPQAASAAAGVTRTGAGTTAEVTAEGDAPLVLTIGSLSPSAVPARGPIRVTGTITNRSEDTWSAVNLYPVASTAPMTTRAELVQAADTEPEAPVGDRLTDRGPYATVDELGPGDSATFTIRVPRSDLPYSSPGVYWFGVHAVGEAPGDPRDTVADGRARTFLPLIEEPRGRAARRNAPAPVRTALVVPVRHHVSHAADGSLAGAAAWARTLGGSGQLRSLTELGAAAGSRQLTWLVDPAVPDAVRQLAAGNPARSLAPTLEQDAGTDPDLAEPDEDAAPVETPSPAPEGDAESSAPEAGEDNEPLDADDAAAQAVAGSWLATLRSGLADQSVLTLPYGDLDVSAAAAHGPAVYAEARARTGAVLAEWEVASKPAVAPATGYLDQAGLDLVAGDDTVLVSDKMVSGRRPTVASVSGRPVVLAASEVAGGGPGPDDRLAPVAMRQRILAEAAVRRLGAGDGASAEPLVVALPATWAPGSTSGFFEGLDQSWLELTTLDRATAVPSTPVADADLRYPAEERARQLGSADFVAAARLRRAGRTLQNLLTRNDRVAAQVDGEALTGLSYASPARALISRERADASREWIEERLRAIDISTPPQVTLSSASGRFSVTIANNLDEPVTVGLDAFADEPIDIEVPDTVELGPRSRLSVLLVARSEQQGVHNVTLVLTDHDGTALGASAQLPIRAAQVSAVIWVIIGAGCALLVGAIGVRLVRRVRRTRLLAAPDPDPTEPGGPDAAGPDASDEPGETGDRRGQDAPA